MYDQIRSRQSVPTLYEEQLIVSIHVCLDYYGHSQPAVSQNEGVITRDQATSLRQAHKAYLTDELAEAENYSPSSPHMLQRQWTGLVWPASNDAQFHPETGVDVDTLKRVGKASVTVPEGFVSTTFGSHF